MSLLNEARSKHAERIWNEYLENYKQYPLPEYVTQDLLLPINSEPEKRSDIIIIKDPYPSSKTVFDKDHVYATVFKVLNKTIPIKGNTVIDCLPYTPFVKIGDKIKYRAPNLKEQEVARKYLYDLIDCVNPKIILLFGNISLHMFKEDNNILKDHGVAFNSMGHLFFPFYSVNYIKKLEGEMKKEAEFILLKDIETCSALYNKIMEGV